jgi:hypothetical protein
MPSGLAVLRLITRLYLSAPELVFYVEKPVDVVGAYLSGGAFNWAYDI